MGQGDYDLLGLGQQNFLGNLGEFSLTTPLDEDLEMLLKFQHSVVGGKKKEKEKGKKTAIWIQIME